MPASLPVAAVYDYILGLHIIAVVLAFGWTFALPIMFAFTAKADPRSLPLMHNIEVRVSRVMLNPALVVILAAGAYLASDGKHWSEFFVQWGLTVVVIIGGVVGAILIPASKRAAEIVGRDLEAYTGGDFVPSAEYQAVAKRINLIGAALSILVLITIVIMAAKP